MSEAIDDFGPIEWLRELFADASAESMYRWMLAAWLVAAAVLIALDRVGWSLQGRSKTRTQTPPRLARLWRWRRADPPATYSMLPSRTVVFEGSTPRLPQSIPLARSAPIEDAEIVVAANGTDVLVEDGTGERLMLAPGPMPNDRYWRSAADRREPIYGLENHVRLEIGRPPERYNPVSDRIETLERDPDTGIASWPRPDDLVWRGLGLGLDDPEAGPDTASTDEIDDPEIELTDSTVSAEVPS
jgi:hypothetical protein